MPEEIAKEVEGGPGRGIVGGRVATGLSPAVI